MERERWSRKIEFLFACIGFAVGYGNFWRFPFKCFQNGGGAFLVAFLICLMLTGIPLFTIELAVGQMTQCGPLKAWKKICPLLSGIGYSMLVLCILISIYYNVILAWSLYYFFHSFHSTLPWVTCQNDWASAKCYEGSVNQNATNITAIGNSPSREFFLNNLLQISGSLYEFNTFNWKLLACLVLAWIMVYFCIWKGIRTTGKVVYVTATLPYVMLFVFLIRGLTLPGALDGASYYFSPTWSKLLEPKVWVDAASQVFYSLTVGFGVMLTFASYNSVNNNFIRDAIIVSLTDAFTSILSGVVVFSIMGYMAHVQNKDITDPTIATNGPGLVFIVYPAALATLPQPNIWSIIFFLMLITLGLDSQFGQVELIGACIIEEYPRKLQKHRELVMLVVCAILCILGLPLTTESGMYWFHLIDTYSAGTSLLVIGIFELVAIAWIFGATNFLKRLEEITDTKVSVIFVYIWKIISPAIILAILLYGFIQHKPLKYEDTYAYPLSAEILGWSMTLVSIVCIPIVAIYLLIEENGTWKERLRTLCSYSEEIKASNENISLKKMNVLDSSVM